MDSVPGVTVNRDLDISALRDRAQVFEARLEALKATDTQRDFTWYPYGTLSNVAHLDNLLTGENRRLLQLIGDGPVVDIGCADGDLAFFLESLGCRAQVLDYGPTNYNGLRGVRWLKEALSSSVTILEVDLDAQFHLPQERYGVVFFLGILYHLKNPYYALEALARSARFCFISTRIARFTPDKQTDFSRLPGAYLLDEREANNDPTNFWIFTDAGLRRILHRTGWEVRDYMRVGNTHDSDPATAQGDERAFCLVESRYRA